MDDNVIKVSCSGHLHDVGKLLDKEELGITETYIQDNADIFQPSYHGKHTHPHGLLTAAFIEKHADLLPPEFNSADWGTGDILLNLAACHHKPETPMQWVISMADRLSSGWDRKEFEDDYNRQVDFKDYRKTRMVPLLETIKPDPGSKVDGDFKYVYPLEPLGPASIFPEEAGGQSGKSNTEARAEYRKLTKDFIQELALLKSSRDNVAIWFENFDSLFMKYASCVPSARAGKVIPDVSLYDHSRSAAALAAAIYIYHRDNGTLNVEAVRNQGDQKFLLISGDFFGIQDFILKTAGDLRKLRSKLLRGRSFTVSLLCELAADLLCREIGLPFSSVVLNAAGKFTVIAPNLPTTVSAIDNVSRRINDWLTGIAFGQSCIGFAYVEASADDFLKGRFIGLRDRLQQKMERQKLQRVDFDRLGGVVSNYLDSFNNNLQKDLCPLCGLRPSAADVENTQYIREIVSSCRICRDHVFIGSNIVKKRQVVISEATGGNFNYENSLMAPIFDFYQVSFFGNLEESERSSRHKILRKWDISLISGSDWKIGSARKFINGYIPVYTDEDSRDPRYLCGNKTEEKTFDIIESIKDNQPKTFSHISLMSLNPVPESEDKFVGIDALGVLKADVDNLGALMTCGLPRESLSVSRLATLSRQINFFFGLYLPNLLGSDHRFQNVYTVFAGGDDLFMIGPWNSVIELSRRLCKDFERYVCNNPEVHFSAGIVFRKANTPVDQMAESAEKELSLSKDGGKNRISLFDQTVTWKDLFELSDIRREIESWHKAGLINNAMLYRLNELMEMAGKEKYLGKTISRLSDLNCTKWRSQLAYTVDRNVAGSLKGDERSQKVGEIHAKLAQWLMKYGSQLRIPVWELLYNIR